METVTTRLTSQVSPVGALGDDFTLLLVFLPEINNDLAELQNLSLSSLHAIHLMQKTHAQFLIAPF